MPPLSPVKAGTTLVEARLIYADVKRGHLRNQRPALVVVRFVWSLSDL